MNKFAMSTVAAAVMVALSSSAYAEKTAEKVFETAGAQTVTENVTVSTSTHDAALIVRNGANVTYSGSSLSFSNTNNSNGQPMGVRVEGASTGNSSLILGSTGSTVNVDVNTTNTDVVAVGLVLRNGGKAEKASSFTVNGDKLNVNVTSAGGKAYGICVQNGTTDDTDFAKMVINSTETVVTVKAGSGKSDGLVVMSQGQLDVNGNLTVTADNALAVRGHSVTNINQTGDKKIVLNGDIVFTYDGPTSATPVDATVNLVLSGSGSAWNGNARNEWNKMSEENKNTKFEELTKVTGLNVTLQNDAQWTPTVVTKSDGKNDQNQHNGQGLININKMTMNGGIINLTEEVVNAKQDVTLDKLAGTGGTINTFVAQAEDGTESVSKVNVKAVESASGTPAFNVVASNVTSDKMTDKTLETLGKSVAVENGTADSAKVTATVKEGAVNGAVSQTFDGTGTATGEAVEAKNTKLDAYSSVVSLGAFTWRHDMNDLTKRMGELRMAPEKTGSWARVYGSELNYGAQNVTSKQNSVQVGTDFDLGNGWKVGGAFSYTDGTATYSAGEADNKAYGLAAYGSWFGEDGQFVDLIAKYSRLSSDFTLGDMGGDYDNNAFSVSAEYGWHFRLNDVAFVEPQAELTYGRIMGDKFTSTNGAHVAQEDFDSLIGRLGVRAGFYFPKDRGTVYARASVLHDFQGEAESKVTLVGDSSVASTLKDDLGGTWYEFGLGANFNLTDTTYVYVDLERTNAGKVVEDYRWNVGVRHAW